MTNQAKRIEDGQTIFVIEKWWSQPVDSELKVYIVTKVNSDCFYAAKEDTRFEFKFDLRTMKHSVAGDVLTAYVSEDEYLEIIEKTSLQTEIASSLADLDLETLRKIKSLIHCKGPLNK